MKLDILEITSEQILLYKQFFAQGLINDEESFRITLTDDLDAPFPTMNKEDSFTLGAYSDGSVSENRKF
ncbi:MAG: hypothetical protein ACR2KZ_17345 [Segetibacter sp.]